MTRIHLIHFEEDLEWFKDPTWVVLEKVNVSGTKFDIMQWLEQNTTGGVLLHRMSSRPTVGETQWAEMLYGSASHCDVWFENPQDAMLFKLSWHSNESV